MTSKFGSVWKRVGPLKTIKFAKTSSATFFSAQSRRGGRLARAVVAPAVHQRRRLRQGEEDVTSEAEEVASVDLGSLLID